jgi:hypothetical protein
MTAHILIEIGAVDGKCAECVCLGDPIAARDRVPSQCFEPLFEGDDGPVVLVRDADGKPLCHIACLAAQAAAAEAVRDHEAMDALREHLRNFGECVMQWDEHEVWFAAHYDDEGLRRPDAADAILAAKEEA